VWDGNEVWLLVAGGATFAAFPEWYATLFSGFYLPLLVILVALILRGVAFEYRGKVDSPMWRRRWDACIIGGSLVPALLWGVAFGNIVRGVKLDANHEYVGSFADLLNPYALLGGLTTLALFTLHGAVFLALKTDGRVRAGRRSRREGGPGDGRGRRWVPAVDTARARTLKIMTWVAVVFTPIVLGCQAWTYWVFRKRLTVDHIPANASPVDTHA
jgi:cytochrome bd-type quinol oxidase subunit 2